MPKATFDKSRLLELHARIGQTGVPIILTFLNEDGTARAIDEEDFLLRVKKRPSSPTAMFDLEIGSGLTVIGPELNKLKIELSEENSDQDPDTNFYTLLSVEENHTWLNGPFKFHNGEYDGVEITDEITIAENGETIEITISAAEIPAGTWTNCGEYDASSDAFPSTGGTGVGGAIKAYNTFALSVGGTLGGVFFNSGAILVALTDDPGQTYTNWRII